MKIILLFIATVVALSACKTTHNNASHTEAYNPFNPHQTHTTFLGAMPSVRPPDMDETQ